MWAALITVYVLWGSTYLGILFAIRTIPPFLMLAARFGTAVAAPLRLVDQPWRPGGRPAGVEAVACGGDLVGGALLLAGNGSVAWSEQHLTSGVASLIVATTPLFFRAVRPDRTRAPASPGRRWSVSRSASPAR